MTRRPLVYGLDIETDTTQDGLDPRVAPVVTVALSRDGGDEVFSGRESTLIFDLDQRLRSLAPGIIATWNGSAFDLPFLARRAASHGLELGLRLSLDPTLTVRPRPATPASVGRGDGRGETAARAGRPAEPHSQVVRPPNRSSILGAYRGAWYHHAHLDAYRLYRNDVGPALRVSCSLKSIARLVGLAPLEVDRTRIHDLTREALHAYASSDARLARVLTQRRMPGAIRFVDRVDDTGTDLTPAAIA